MTKIDIGIINSGNIRSEVLGSITHAFKYDPKDKIGSLIQAQGPYIDDNRNDVINLFLLSNSEWLMFVDADVEVDLNHIYTLYDIATKYNLYIVGGIYFYGVDHHSLNIRPALMQKNEYGMEEASYHIPDDVDYFEVTNVGTGCMLIHRSVFEKINNLGPDGKNYWFKTYREDTGFIGEDVYFCRLAKENGYKIYATQKVTPNHYKTVIFNYDIFINQQNFLNKIEKK